ncbi:MAG: hypothetical protein ACI861_002036 [Paracoccaceae bacterium]|jgi:hypothetical protein
MAAIIGFVFGAIVGGLTARKRGGNLMDILQYGAVFGIMLALFALFASIIAFRMGWI